MSRADPLAAFIEAACVPLDRDHREGTLEAAEQLLAEHPDLASRSVHAAAILGDAAAVRRSLALDPEGARRKGGPRDWDPLTHLCFSRYLRLVRDRSAGFVDAARSLLEAGADADTGWSEAAHRPRPVRETALYGAAGVAHHGELTALLLAHGADPNDEEVPYHAPETHELGVLRALVESERLNADSLATMLLRKADWHDLDGIRYLLDQGADPNRMTRWHRTPLHQALLRDNGAAIVEALLDHGADPMIECRGDGRSALSIAVRRGRDDVLAALDRRGISTTRHGVERLIAACARADAAAVRAAAREEPKRVTELVQQGGRLLAEFAGVGNTAGVRLLLDLGVEVGARFMEGDDYWDLAPGSTALHAAAWRARHETVRLLLERGAAADAVDGRERTPLALAVRACVDSYWTDRRSPESVEALLRAGASARGIPLPTGYAAIDTLLGAVGP